jgi:predicted transcriptional regulator
MSDRASEIQLVFDTLAKEGAVQILDSLKAGRKTQKQVATETGLSASRVSACINAFRLAGIATQEGVRNAYIDVSHVSEEIDELLESAIRFRRTSADSIGKRLDAANSRGPKVARAARRGQGGRSG